MSEDELRSRLDEQERANHAMSVDICELIKENQALRKALQAYEREPDGEPPIQSRCDGGPK